MLRRFLFTCCRKRTFFGVSVGAFLPSKEQKSIVYVKLEQALLLIRVYDPRRFAQIQQDVQCILVLGDPPTVACWHQALRMIEVDDRYLCADDTSVAALACTLVHEATHARLCRLGFGYEEPKRLQVERICFKTQRAFARRLPQGEELVREAEEMMASYGAEYFSDAGQHARDLQALRNDLQALRNLGCPAWMVRLLDRLAARRAA